MIFGGTKNNKTALVLGSGAARGLAHIGVIKAIQEKDVKIDMVVGSSIGALIGACYAKEGSIDKIEQVVLDTDWMKMIELADTGLAFLLRGFIRGDKVKDLLETVIGDIDFKELKYPLAVTATDINTGEAVILDSGSVLDAVRASISMPVVFMPVKLNGRYLIDGGVVDPLPVDVARGMGAKRLIASNVIQPIEERAIFNPKRAEEERENKKGVLNILNEKMDSLIKEDLEMKQKVKDFMFSVHKKVSGISFWDDPDIKDTPNIFETMIRAVYSMEYHLVTHKKEKADILISPKTGHISSLEFYRAEESIEKGYSEGMKKL